MKHLQEYINEELLYNHMNFLKEDPINEGIIMNGIKKLWRWIKQQFSDDEEGLTQDQIDNPKFNSYEYSYNKIKNKLSKHKIFDDIKNNEELSKIKIVLTYINDNKNWESLFAYVPYTNSPLKNKIAKYNYIYTFIYNEKYESIADKLLKNYLTYVNHNIKKEYGDYDGFILNENEYKNHDELYKNLKFTNRIKIQIENKTKILYSIKIKDLLNQLNENKIYEELDDNLFYLLDMWFNTRENEQNQFIDLIIRCKQDKVANEKNLEKYIKGTFLETQLHEFIDFLENDIIPNTQKNYLYSLKKIIDTIMFDKTNKYIKKGED